MNRDQYEERRLRASATSLVRQGQQAQIESVTMMSALGPWPCPYCRQLVYLHQVHRCRPKWPWEYVSPYDPPADWATNTTITIAPKPKPPGEAMRPEDV